VNDLQQQFLAKATQEAIRANHPWPRMAACEAALESTWGHSELAMTANNLFGMKQHAHPIYGTMTLPTHECLDGKWMACSANWVKYPDWRGCFADRLATLERLSNVYPHYKAALAAGDAQTYIVEVSKTWSTDPQRAEKVLDLYREYIALSSGSSSQACPRA